MTDPIRQAILVLAHAQFKPGDKVKSTCSFQEMSELGAGVPIGFTGKINENNRYGVDGTVAGIDADGNVWVFTGNATKVAYPYSPFLLAKVQGEYSVKLNNSYSAVIALDGKTLRVGCQDFPIERLDELVAARDKQRAHVAAGPEAVTLPATFEPSWPLPVKAKTPVRATKKVPAKKVPARKGSR